MKFPSEKLQFPSAPARGSAEHVRAASRRDAAVADRGRARDRFLASMGTPDEGDTSIVLADARDRLAAREAWLTWIERDS